MNDTTYPLDAQAELAQLRAKVEALMAERVTPAVAAIAGQAEDAARAAGAQLRDGVDQVTDRVRQQPLAALGVAALAGFVLASLIRR